MKTDRFLMLFLAFAGLGGCVPDHWPEAWRAHNPPDDQFEPRTYCYKTLAEVDCYDAPQLSGADKLVGIDPPYRPLPGGPRIVTAPPPPPRPRAVPPQQQPQPAPVAEPAWLPAPLPPPVDAAPLDIRPR